MKNIIVFAMTACLALLLVGCSSGNSDKEPANTQPAASGTTEAEPQDLQLLESGYCVESSGYVHYAVGVKNPNKWHEAQLYTLRVTGKDKDGVILFSNDQTMGFLIAGEENWFAGQAGNGSAPATVDFQVVAKDKNWIKNDHVAEPVYTIEQTNEVPGDYGAVSYTGTITALKEWKDVNSAWVSVIYRDEAGAIVGGDYTYVDISEAGETVPFEIHALDPPAHASFQIAAIPWF